MLKKYFDINVIGLIDESDNAFEKDENSGLVFTNLVFENEPPPSGVTATLTKTLSDIISAASAQITSITSSARTLGSVSSSSSATSQISAQVNKAIGSVLSSSQLTMAMTANVNVTLGAVGGSGYTSVGMQAQTQGVLDPVTMQALLSAQETSGDQGTDYVLYRRRRR